MLVHALNSPPILHVLLCLLLALLVQFQSAWGFTAAITPIIAPYSEVKLPAASSTSTTRLTASASIQKEGSDDDSDGEPIVQISELDVNKLFPDAPLEDFTLLPHRPLGITIEESLANSDCVFVSRVVEGGNADQAGIQVGDLLVAVTGLFGDLSPVMGVGVEKV